LKSITKIKKNKIKGGENMQSDTELDVEFSNRHPYCIRICCHTVSSEDHSIGDLNAILEGGEGE
jgi:hypothetical protein